MSVTVSQLVALVKVEGGPQAMAALIEVGTTSESVGSKLKMLSIGAIAVVGAALIGMAVVSVKAAADFQQSITKLYTTAGESKGNLQMIGDGILAMAGQVGIGAQKLVDAMYWVSGAGFHGAQGLEVLRIAAMGAKAENSDLIPVAHALTGVLNTYSSTGITAAQAMNVLIASTGQGAMTLADLSSAISNVLPAASKFHLSLIDITTGIATMTNQNDNASSAATHLRQVILALESPAKAGAKALAEIGLSSTQVSDAMRKSLPGAIEMIINDLGKKFPEGSAAYNDALKAIAGGNKQLLGLLELSGTSLDKWKKSVLAVKNAVDQGGNSIMGWSDVQGNFNFKIDQAKAAFGSLVIMLGTNLLPLLTPLIANVATLVTNFTQWANSGHAASDVIKFLSDSLTPMGRNAQIVLPIVIGLAAAILWTLVPAMWAAVPAIWTFASGMIAATWPFLAVAAAVAAVVAIFLYFYRSNAGFKAFIDNMVRGLQQLWQIIVTNVQPAWQNFVAWFQGTFLPAMQKVGAWLKTEFLIAWQNLVNWWNGTLLPAIKRLADFWQKVLWPALVQIGQFLVTTFVPIWQQLVSTWNSQVLPSLQQLWQLLQSQVIPPFLQFVQIVQTQVIPAFQQIWQVIQTQVVPILARLLPPLKMVGEIVGGIVVVAIVLLVGLLAGAIRFIATFITGLIQFWGGVIQFFTGLIQFVSGIVQLIVDLLTGNFGKLKADLGTIWLGIQNMWNGLWTAVSGVTTMFIGSIISFFQGFGQTIWGIFVALYHNLVGHSIIPDMINGIINWFLQLPGRVGAAIISMVTSVTGKLAGLLASGLTWAGNFVIGLFNALNKLAAQAGKAIQTAVDKILSTLAGALKSAAQAGLNIVTAIANGIINAISSVLGNAMNQVGSFISSHLPHSPAKVGPLMHLAEQGSSIPAEIAKGMLAGMPAIQSSLNLMLTPTPSLGSMGGIGALSFPSMNQQQAPVIVNLQMGDTVIDGYRLSGRLMPYIAQHIRESTGAKF